MLFCCSTSYLIVDDDGDAVHNNDDDVHNDYCDDDNGIGDDDFLISFIMRHLFLFILLLVWLDW